MNNIKETMDAITKIIENMTTEEFRQSLIDAGIIDDDGELTEGYRSNEDEDEDEDEDERDGGRDR